MSVKNKYLNPGSIFDASPAYLLLAVSGLSFCFFLGFPFENHNESFLWIVIFSKVSFWDTLTKQVIPIESFRPLGVANAWLTYKLSGNIYLQQILNWLFALASFVLLFSVSRNKILFSLLSLAVCACFFAGYIYLFHLHGVFYGPFQLYVAGLTYIASKKRRLSSSLLAVIFVVTLFVALYHTFTLLVFCSFLSGYLLQLSKEEKKIQYIRLIILILFSLALGKLILQAKSIKPLHELVDGLVTSFRMAEVNTALACIAALLALLAAMPLIKSLSQRIITGLFILFLAAVLMYLHIPVLFLWIGICFVKVILNKEMAMAGLIAATTILPVGSSSGSPTYTVFVLMVCAFVTTADEILYIPDSLLLRRLSVGFVALLFGMLAVIKIGFHVPLIASIARPVLAEQEKTSQLKNIIDWKLKNKEYAPATLVLYDAAGIPVAAKNSVDRTNRPVVSQDHLSNYVTFLSKDIATDTITCFLYITFGNKILRGKQLVFSVNGPWNGKAYVYK